MKKKEKNNLTGVYATVSDDEGVNYREIAETMTKIGFKMNHSSARNYVLRIMKKFAEAIVEGWELEVNENTLEKTIKSPQFQNAICGILQSLDSDELGLESKDKGKKSK